MQLKGATAEATSTLRSRAAAQISRRSVGYFRNTVLDANDYFLGQVVQKQNIFGGDIGGPIGPAAKLGYFISNIQGTRQRSGDSRERTFNTSIPVLPTARDATRCSILSSTALTALVLKRQQLTPWR